MKKSNNITDPRGRHRDMKIDNVCKKIDKYIRSGAALPSTWKVRFDNPVDAMRVDVRTYAQKIRTSASLRELKQSHPEYRFVIVSKGAGGAVTNCVYVCVKAR